MRNAYYKLVLFLIIGVQSQVSDAFHYQQVEFLKKKRNNNKISDINNKRWDCEDPKKKVIFNKISGKASKPSFLLRQYSTTSTTLCSNVKNIDITALDEAESLAPVFPDSSNDDINANAIKINEMTTMLLDEINNPLGSLSGNVLNSVYFLMDKWAKCGLGDEGAIVVERILQRLLDEADAGNIIARESISPKLCTVAMDAWARSKSPEGPKRALSILDQISLSDQKHAQLKPNTHLYNTVINSFSKAGYTKEAEDLLDRMLQSNKVDLRPNVISFNAVLDAYARASREDPKAAEKAEALLQMMRSSTCNTSNNIDTNKHNLNHIQPDLISFNSVIDAYAKAGNPEKAELILKQMEEDDVKPDEVSHSCVIQAWARSGSPESAERALSILEQMESDQEQSSGTQVRLDIMSWNIVLDCLAKHGKAIEAEQLLKRMEKEETGVHPNTVSYNTVINSISKSGESNAATHALEVLERMEALHEEGILTVKPDVFSYTTVINAFSNVGQPQKAEALMEKMVEISHSGEENVFPNTVTVNNVISAYARSNETGAPQRAEKILTRMEDLYTKGHERLKPNAISYTSVIDVFAKSKDPGAYDQAQAIFERMQQMYKAGNLNAKPNVHTYNTLLNAVARQNNIKAVQRAEQILLEMEEKYQNEGDEDAKPNVVSYTTVMTAMVRSGANDSAEKAEKLLNKMEEIYAHGNLSAKPNSHSYSVVISAYIRKGGAQGVEKAHAILERMEDAFKAGNSDVKPNVINYTALIDAWSKSGVTGCGEKAEEVLKRMETLHAEFDNDPNFKPNFLSFNACINAWAKSRSFEKAQRAKDILNRMITLSKEGDTSVKPNVFTFSSVLNACAYSSGDTGAKQAALLIAADTYKQIAAPPNEFGKPNHITYATFLKACKNLIPAGTDARASSVETVFRKCCNDGQVNDLVLRELKAAVVSKDHLLNLLDGVTNNGNVESVQCTDLPSQWRKNVKEVERKYRRQRK